MESFLKRQGSKQDVIIGGIISVVCIVAYFLVLFSGVHTKSHSDHILSPGSLAEFSFITLAILGIILLVSGLAMGRKEGAETEVTERLDRTRLGQVAMFTFVVIVYIHLIDVIGYYSSTFAALIVVMLLLKIRSWFKMVLTSIILLVVIYFFFEEGLKILLPRGFMF